jgi:hypothetical protein
MTRWYVFMKTITERLGRRVWNGSSKDDGATIPAMRAILAGTLLLMYCAVAHSQTITGEAILRKCKGTSSKPTAFDDGFCAGYIEGVMSTARMPEAVNNHPSDVKFCVPSTAAMEHVRWLFVNYLEDHPEELHKPANVLVIALLRKHFLATRLRA